MIYRLYLIAASLAFYIGWFSIVHDQLSLGKVVYAYVFMMASDCLGWNPLVCETLGDCIGNAGGVTLKRHAACDECSKSTMIMAYNSYLVA